ncbi:type II and III secretion system protein family protein [Humisphaera borealis]|uniref:Type II and III secretion system protein family protein n=1 Tax=Humisphaera borealis TaxID=2807512 RepID=A0A7M2WV53_9BACT|nr:type II and III secretion system protein family protein [Humisphaera borealis]QOV89269.1 type II and III secretion system protein family protein [Humisphaera borealis]
MSTFNQNNDLSNQKTLDEASNVSDERKRSRRRLRVAAAIGAALLVPYVIYADDSSPVVNPPAIELPAGDALPESAPVTPIVLAEPATPAPAAAPATAPATPATAPSAVTPIAAPMLPGTPVIATTPATRPADAVASLFENVSGSGPVKMLVGRSMVLKTKAPFKRMSLTQPEVVGDNLVDPTSILLTAKKAGVSQLIVWDDKDRSEVLDIVVDVDLKLLSELVKTHFPTATVELSAVNGTLVARGRVPNLQTAEQITEMLGAYGKVLNFLEMAGGQQVMLQVRFAEVSRTASTELGVNFGMNDGTGKFQVPIGGTLAKAAGGNVTLIGGGSIGSTQFDILVSALRNNSLLRMLAEPNLATLSGKEAEFLAGGEIPIPVPQSGGGNGTTITIEYKQFGIRLAFTPIVLGDGKIRIQASAEVSELDYTKSVSVAGTQVPGLSKRTVTTTIELSEGQTFSLAGLLNNKVTANKSAVPLLGDIPILGALFRSVKYERNETELVVLVTPRLVEAMNPSQVPELPGERWNYPSESDLFIKQYLGGPGTDPGSANKPAPSAFRGPYGFVPVSNPVTSGAAGQRVTSVNQDARPE